MRVAIVFGVVLAVFFVASAAVLASEASCMRQGVKISTRSADLCERMGGRWQDRRAASAAVPSAPAVDWDDAARGGSGSLGRYFFVLTDADGVSACTSAPRRDNDQEWYRQSGERLYGAPCTSLTDADGVILVNCRGGIPAMVVAAPDAAQCRRIRQSMSAIAR